MTWNQLNELIPHAAGKYNLAKTLKAIDICREYRSLAGTHLPPKATDQTKPSFKEGTLTIGVRNPAWAQQLNMKRHIILRELNKKFGERTVRAIKIRHIELDKDPNIQENSSTSA